MTHYIPLYFGRTVLVLPSIELARFYHLSLLPPEIGLGKKSLASVLVDFTFQIQ
jgi:hypothetical protein